MNMYKMLLTLFVVLMCWTLAFTQNTISWNFENGSNHGFALRCQKPATPATDDPAVAGDEAITGVGGADGLPSAGVAWTIGPPNIYDGLAPAFVEGSHVVNGLLQYNATNDPFGATTDTLGTSLDPPYDFTNGRGQSSYLGTYQLNQWGDGLNSATNDQIATSPKVLLGVGAELRIWAVGNTTAGWAGVRTAPILDPDPAEGYVSGSGGIAVLSAADGSLLDALAVKAEGVDSTKTPKAFTLDLSALAGQEVIIEVVDAFAGGWGFYAIDEIQITNATEVLPATTISWDFENGNNHGFALRCIIPADPADDNPNIAGDESITGVWDPTVGDVGLPNEGVAWTIGPPNQFDGLIPAVIEGSHVVNDVLQYNDSNDPFGVFGVTPPSYTNGRGQSSYLNTYNLSQWGDGLHKAFNDQIATSPKVLLGDGSELTVWAVGNTQASWAGTRIAPEFDADPVEGYAEGCGGITVLSAADSSLLASLLIAAEGVDNTRSPDAYTLDLSALAGQEVVIEVVDAFEGGWGWLAIDEIQISNATLVTGVESAKSSVPAQFELEQNFPNPFNPSTQISYGLDKRTNVELTIYNTLGQKIATLVNGFQPSGNYQVVWDASKASAGIYIYMIKTDSGVQSKKMLLIK